MDGRVHYEIGAYRICREGKIDQGRDGLLWLPVDESREDASAVAAVADGIGLEGEGQAALDDFERCYTWCQHIRMAVLELLKERHCSTFVGLQLPQTIHEPGWLISVGDSSAIQVRREGDRVSEVHLLQNPHTFLYYLLEQFPEIESFVRRHEQHQQLTFEELDHFYDILKPYLKSAFSLKSHRKAFRKSLRLASVGGNVQQFQDKVFLLFYRLKDFIILDLASSKRDVEQVIGYGKQVYFRPGDDFLLHTDGMDLSPEAIANILDQSSPLEAAERLVKASQKEDDRAVIVVRVREGVPQQRFTESVRRSLLPSRPYQSEAS